MTTGEKIRFYRKLNHMTLEELGDKCGVQKSVVAKWEKDLVDLKQSRIMQLAVIFGDVLLSRVPQGSIGIHKIKVYKEESAVSASIGVHRLTQKETLGETLGDAGHKKRGRQLSLPFFVVRL